MEAITRNHNSAQINDLRKIRAEVKWLVGEKLGYDPDTTKEGRAEVEKYLAGVIISGAGNWMAERVSRNIQEN